MLRQSADIKKLAEMIGDIRIAMLTTVDAQGELRSRPMATQKVDFAGELWFFTRGSGGKIEEIEHDAHINVAYAKPDEGRFVSVSGTAHVEHDSAKMQELWDQAYLEYLPGGLTDPDLALLRVTVTHAEYWTTPGPQSAVVAAKSVGFNRSVMTSRATGQDEQWHGRLEFLH